MVFWCGWEHSVEMRTRLICGLLLLLLMRSSFGIECSLAETRAGNQGEADKTKVAATKVDAAKGDSPASGNQMNMLISVNNRLAKVALLSPQLIICDVDEIQALADPAGYIVLTRGILKLIEADENVAAFIIGHEFAHLVLRHSMQQAIQDQRAVETGAAVGTQYERESGRVGVGVLVERQVAAALSAKFSRNQESEADQTGYQMILAAGFDPNGAVKATKLMIAYSQEGNRPSGYFSSHPGWGARLAVLERVVVNETHRRKLIAAAKEQAEANDRFSAIADELVASKKAKALALHVADWLRQIPESGVAWYYKGVQLQMSRSSKGLALDAFEKAVTYNPELADAWVSLCVGLFQEGYKLESASCSRNIKYMDSLDEFHSKTEPPLAFVGGFNVLPPPLYIGRDANGSRILTNDEGVLKSRDLPLTPMPPYWKRLPE